MKPDTHEYQSREEALDACVQECIGLGEELKRRGVGIPPDVMSKLVDVRFYRLMEGVWDLDSVQQLERELRALLPADGEGKPTAGGDQSLRDRDILAKIRLHISELFHDRDSTPFAEIRVHGVTQVHAIESEPFMHWLTKSAYHFQRKAAAKHVLEGWRQTLAAEARFDGREYEVFNRVGRLHDNVFIDLGTSDWSVVKVEPGSWSVVTDSPVKFWRPASAQALPAPVSGGSIDPLWNYLNVEEEHRPIVLAWILATLLRGGPYPLLALQGEQGTAKSSAARFLKLLTDPSKAPLRSLPSNEFHLANAAHHSHVLVFDNLSRLSDDMSDALCRLSTGGGIARRKLYTDSDEVVLEIQCPVIVTSITDVITRPDLADRTYHVKLDYIEPEHRRSEHELSEAFKKDAPRMFGAILDALAYALDRAHTVSVTALPRLADAARIAVAAEPALGLASGSMEQALAQNSLDFDLAQLADVPFFPVLKRMADKRDWDLTATELLDQLGREAGEEETAQLGWPLSVKTLSQKLDRIAPVLRRQGIEISRYKTPGSNSQRMIRIRRVDKTSR